MALTDFKPYFDNAYQEIFQKILVGKSIANLRFEPVLKYGGTVQRVAYDISNVLVRAVTRGSASTIDTITDSVETLTVNNEYEAVFHISDGEVTQAGPLNPGEVIGGKIGAEVAEDLDARILFEITNAYQTFDNGDLTTLVSTGTPITPSSTTVPQMATRLPAKLKRGANQILTNMALVIDAYMASDLAQYLLGKNFDIVNYVFKNGDAGEQFAQAAVYISENLTGDVTLTFANAESGHDTLWNGEVFTINGVQLKFTSAAPAAVGEVSLATTLAAAWTNLKAALESPETSVALQYYAHTGASMAILKKLRMACTISGSTFRIQAKGGGRLVVTETISQATFNSPFLHCYYGKKGAIDVVVQSLKPVDMRPTADRRGTNVFSSYLAGIKTYADGAKKFLDVQIIA